MGDQCDPDPPVEVSFSGEATVAEGLNPGGTCTAAARTPPAACAAPVTRGAPAAGPSPASRAGVLTDNAVSPEALACAAPSAAAAATSVQVRCQLRPSPGPSTPSLVPSPKNLSGDVEEIATPVALVALAPAVILASRRRSGKGGGGGLGILRSRCGPADEGRGRLPRLPASQIVVLSA